MAPVAQAVQVVQAAPRVPAAHHVQVALAHVQASAVLVQVALRAVHQVVPQEPVLPVQAAAQVEVVVAASAAALLVLLVRVALAVRARLASQSVRNAKSLNSAAMHHRSVVR